MHPYAHRDRQGTLCLVLVPYDGERRARETCPALVVEDEYAPR